MQYAAYTIQNNRIVLCRLYGMGEAVFIPGMIEGRPVEVLADHLLASEMTAMYPSGGMRLACLEGDDWNLADTGEQGLSLNELEKDAVKGSAVRSVRIPEGVRQIGNYAFYGLYELREVSFPSTIRQIGWGMFNGCRKVGRLEFHIGDECTATTPPILQEVLDSVPNETEVIVNRGNAQAYRLRFPQYYEEGKENTPARIIEIIYHGTGRQYRNCFLHRELQFDMYDELFPLAAAQEDPVTNVHLIIDRLTSGPAPKEDALARYIDYLRLEYAVMIDEIIKDRECDPVPVLTVLNNLDYFTSMIVDSSIQIASGAGCPQAVSFLMELRGRSMSHIRKSRYEL